MGQTRKKKPFTEQFLRSKLTVKHYDTYLDTHFYFGEDPFKLPADDEWDPRTGNCGWHARFTIETLIGALPKSVEQYKGFKEIQESTIEALLQKLDSGSLIEILHQYRHKSLAETLPRNNVYDSHDFVLVKGGTKYFLSQGFQYAYKHSLTSYTREQIRNMLQELLTHTCDPQNTKRWSELDLSYYKKYFKADLLVGKLDQTPVVPSKKVNGIILEYLEIKR